MTKVLFATSNARKIKEANRALGRYGIKVEPVKVEVDEIQDRDPVRVVKEKARAAYQVLQKPVIVSDTSWAIPALGGFPGAYMKDVTAWLAANDWLFMMARHEDKTIYCYEHIVYYDGNHLQHFVEKYTGRFTERARGRVHPEESLERVVVMYGNQTMAEQLERGQTASAGAILHHWRQFAEWYR